MTDCNVPPLRFASLGRKAVVADFGGGRLTTDAGALRLRETADRLRLFDALDAAIPDPRHPLFIVHDQKAMIAQRVIAIALGTRTSTTTRPSAPTRRCNWPQDGPPTPSCPSPRHRRSVDSRIASIARH